jgi:UDP-4-amino-4,6-dideoxy-N-acetyl-beta-L-altrosamine transaminase
MIPYAKQVISEQDIDAVAQLLRSDYLTQGPVGHQFEQAVADYCGASYGIAVNSATSALHVACLALGLGPGDLLWTSPITFVASANCALYCGASVDFVDINSITGNLCPEALAKKLAQAEQNGTLPKIVIPVHYSGHSCSMQAIYELSQRYGFKIIEDASHAIGGSHQDVKIGACTYSEVTVFSFHPVKIITTGEGGMLVTKDNALAHKMRLLSSHGITRDPDLLHKTDEGTWYYEQQSLGFNYRLSNIHAALGLSQLQHLDEFVAKRHDIVQFYQKALSHLPITLPVELKDSYSAWHLYVIQLQLDKIKMSRKELYSFLWSHGVGVNVHYIPVHLQPFYAQRGFKPGDFPIAEQFYERILSLPMHVGLTQEELNEVVRVLDVALSG